MSALTLQQAQRLVQDLTAKALSDYQRPVCAAVCDATGLLLAFARMDGSPVRSIAIAQGKAYSAARMGVRTQAFRERLQREELEVASFCDPLLTSLPGGTPLIDAASQVIGAVGVSGLAIEEDQQLSDAIAKTFAA